MMMPKYIRYTPEQIRRFKVAYRKALKSKQERFTFDGDAFLTGFSKYLIEYWKMEKAKRKQK